MRSIIFGLIIPDDYVPDVTTLVFLSNEFAKISQRAVDAAYRGDFLLSCHLLKFADVLRKGYYECDKALHRHWEKLERKWAEQFPKRDEEYPDAIPF